MRTLLKLLTLLVLLGVFAVLLAAGFMLSSDPLVSQQASLAHEDIARAKAILRRNDPRRLPPGTQREIEIRLQDLDLAANYLAQRIGGNARLAIEQDRLAMHGTLRLPALRWRPYLNLEAVLAAPDGQLQLRGLQIGQLALPPPMAIGLLRYASRLIYDQSQLETIEGIVRDVRLLPEHVRVTYRWNPALIEQARDTLLSADDRAALRFYIGRLVELQNTGAGLRGSLAGLLATLFDDAAQRARDHDPVAENVALLTVLGTWAGGQDVRRLVPGAPRPGRFRLKLRGRIDFAQHFLVSAALAARGDSTLSDAVGLFKELSDTDRGSGFSFTDLAADRAGTRFGALAVRSSADARRLQHRLAVGFMEADIMPSAKDLPEHMDAQTFVQRYGEVGSPAYREVMAEIERRIDSVSLHAAD